MQKKHNPLCSGLRGKIRRLFFPDRVIDSVSDLDRSALIHSGIRVMLLDIDNTLARHGSRTADSFAKSVCEEIASDGIIPCICSNAKNERAQAYADSLGLRCIARAKKPSPDAILDFLKANNLQKDEVLMVGDQLITDVCAARRAGIPVVLVRPIDKKEIITVRLKRPLEKLLILLGGKDHFTSLEDKT